MSKYNLFGFDGEINGLTIQACVESNQGAYLQPFLARYDLLNIDPNKWYPLSLWLDFLNAVYDADSGAASASYIAIGMREIEKVPFPPHIQTLAQALEGIEGAYHYGYRGEEIGNVYAEKLGDQSYRIVCAIPFPDDYLYGVLYGLARRFLAKGTPFTVLYDSTSLPRDAGGEATNIDVRW